MSSTEGYAKRLPNIVDEDGSNNEEGTTSKNRASQSVEGSRETLPSNDTFSSSK